jgi:glycosyltransferase involved in cell wall biosynthesis
MKILFVHQNFPGQFKSIAPFLIKKGHKVSALKIEKSNALQVTEWRGVSVTSYPIKRGTTKGIHPWVADFETKTIRGEACLLAAKSLAANGYTPDVIIAHPGWGESLFLKEVWPSAKLGIYCEFYYSSEGQDVGFDPEFPNSNPLSNNCRLKLKNLNNLLHFGIADAGLSPTNWQASTFPNEFRNKISVIHDGIDTRKICPDENATLTLSQKGGYEVSVSRKDEIVTFVNRNLEPYRGYHVFMRALPEILKSRPKARVIIVGGNSVSYGSGPEKKKYGNKSWAEIFEIELRSKVSSTDLERIHFAGTLPFDKYLRVLQISSCHVYLTYPFVLSWSLLEAMSAGCPIVASGTKPVQEVITDKENGILVDFFDVRGLSESVINLLKDKEKSRRISKVARDFVVSNYDLNSVTLPKQVKWIANLYNPNSESNSLE